MMTTPRCTRQTGKVLSRQDELSEWIANFDRYNPGGRSGGDRGAYLRLYNGGRYTMDRIGRGSFVAPSWSACVLGGIQPSVIQKIAQDATDDGLLQRFTYCVAAHVARGLDRRPKAEALRRYRELFKRLAALLPGTASRVVLHADAHQHRLAILNMIDGIIALPDTSDRLKSALGKWPGLFARLALTFHLIEVADARQRGERGQHPNVVLESTARRVASYMRDILLPHLLRADAIMFQTTQTGHARWIAGYILSKGLIDISARDVTRAYRDLRAPEQRETLVLVMRSLETLGWIREELTLRRDSAKWRVNPRVHELFAEQAKQERQRRDEAQDLIRTAAEQRRQEKQTGQHSAGE